MCPVQCWPSPPLRYISNVKYEPDKTPQDVKVKRRHPFFCKPCLFCHWIRPTYADKCIYGTISFYSCLDNIKIHQFLLNLLIKIK